MQPSQVTKNDIKILIRSVVHTYHPEIIEQSKVRCQDLKQRNNSPGVNHIDLVKYPILNKTVCNVQPSQKLALRVFFLPLPFCKEKLQFLNK